MPARVVIFLGLAAFILASSVLYLGWRLIHPSRLGPRGRRVAWVALASCALAAIATLVIGRALERSQLTNIQNIVGFTGMGVLLTLLPFVLARDLLLLVARPFSGPRSSERGIGGVLSRRAVLGAAGGTLALGLTQAGRGPVIIEIDVPIDGLPAALHGYRIAQVSDLHIGPVLGESWLQEIVGLVNGLSPDLIAVTGDLVDGRVEEIQPLLAPLRDLRASDGRYFVTGNHEYYWDAPRWIEALGGLGLTVLKNEHRVIERAGARVIVAGVHDHKASSIEPTHTSDPAAALAGAPGHTHGGQFFPANLLVHLFQPVVAGLHRFDRLQVYVNRGTGWWGPPIRSPARGEITLLRLTPAK